MLKDRQLILAKIQPSIDTDPVPTPEANALVASDMEFSVVARRMERAQSIQWMGAKPPLNIGEALKIRFKTEIRGKGLGVAPEVGPLLRSCNYTETVTPDTKVNYDLNSKAGVGDGSEMCTIYFYQDKLWHVLKNCRGTVSSPLKAGDYAMDQWEFTGTYAGAARVSVLPTGTFDTTIPPRFIAALTTIGGYSPKFESLTLDLGNNVVKRVNANAATGIEEWMITDRAPKGSIDPELPDLVAAALTTALAGVNNDLVFTAHATNYPGITGNDITIEYEAGGTAGAEVVTVTGTAIKVTCDVVAPASTAAQVRTAVMASAAAMALLASVAHAPANDGSGEVIVMAAAPLIGGAGLDFWKKWTDSEGMAIVATVGQTAGNKCKFTCAGAVLEVPTYADRENMLTHGLNFTLHPSAGNDEMAREYS